VIANCDARRGLGAYSGAVQPAAVDLRALRAGRKTLPPYPAGRRATADDHER